MYIYIYIYSIVYVDITVSLCLICDCLRYSILYCSLSFSLPFTGLETAVDISTPIGRNLCKAEGCRSCPLNASHHCRSGITYFSYLLTFLNYNALHNIFSHVLICVFVSDFDVSDIVETKILIM